MSHVGSDHMDSNINPITCQLRTKFSHLKMEIIIVPSHRVLWLPLHSISSPDSTPATWTLQTIVGLYTFAYSAPLQFTCPTSLMQDLVHSYPLRSSLIVFNKHIWFSWAWHVWRYFLVSFVIGLGLCDKIWSMFVGKSNTCLFQARASNSRFKTLQNSLFPLS